MGCGWVLVPFPDWSVLSVGSSSPSAVQPLTSGRALATGPSLATCFLGDEHQPSKHRWQRYRRNFSLPSHEGTVHLPEPSLLAGAHPEGESRPGCLDYPLWPQVPEGGAQSQKAAPGGLFQGRLSSGSKACHQLPCQQGEPSWTAGDSEGSAAAVEDSGCPELPTPERQSVGGQGSHSKACGPEQASGLTHAAGPPEHPAAPLSRHLPRWPRPGQVPPGAASAGTKGEVPVPNRVILGIWLALG